MNLRFINASEAFKRFRLQRAGRASRDCQKERSARLPKRQLREAKQVSGLGVTSVQSPCAQQRIFGFEQLGVSFRAAGAQRLCGGHPAQHEIAGGLEFSLHLRPLCGRDRRGPVELVQVFESRARAFLRRA